MTRLVEQRYFSSSKSKDRIARSEFKRRLSFSKCLHKSFTALFSSSSKMEGLSFKRAYLLSNLPLKIDLHDDTRQVAVDVLLNGATL